MKDVIIVTRNDDVSSILTRALKKNGYRIVTAPTVEESLMKVQGKPQIIIFDISPPYREALEECRSIKTDPSLKDVPLVALFNAVWERDRREVFEHTCADTLLNKPFTLKEFRETVYSWV